MTRQDEQPGREAEGNAKASQPCGAIWYHDDGQGRHKHVCHRPPRHRDRHHSDGGLWWSRHPHARRVRLNETEPCPDCQPT
jgi:hypothetical protein